MKPQVDIDERYIAIAKRITVLVLVTAVVIGVEYTMWRYLGPIDTVVLTLAFIVGAVIIPTVTALAGGFTPNMLATINDILGAVAYGRTILVQRDDRWELAPATRTRVYIDGVWHRIEGGLNNWSIYAWRPFGILRFKDDDTLSEVRSDTAAERGRKHTKMAADGQGTVTRGGVERVSPPPVSGRDGWWAVDLTRLYSRGLRKMGDIDLIETAEEIAARAHASEGITRGHEAIVAFVVTLLLGIGTGAVLFGFIG